MELISAWGEHSFKVGFYHEYNTEDWFILKRNPFEDMDAEAIMLTEKEVGEFIDCILVGIENVSSPSHLNETILTIMPSKQGLILVSWLNMGDSSVLMIRQGEKKILQVPTDSLQSCLSWLLREFYILGLPDTFESQ